MQWRWRHGTRDHPKSKAWRWPSLGTAAGSSARRLRTSHVLNLILKRDEAADDVSDTRGDGSTRMAY